MQLCTTFSFAALALLLFAAAARGSMYDPHVPSKRAATFFEGWYSRIATADGNSSFAVFFGLCNVAAGSAALPLAVITIAHQDNGSPLQSLRTFTALPSASAITITRRGVPVTSNPNFKTPPDFRWDAGQYGYQETQGGTTTINFTLQGASFYAQTSGLSPWASDASGFGPAGALDELPLPLHWYVLSLHSSVAAYSFVSIDGNISGRSGRAHMEKNWGLGFPDRWMWAQGSSTAGDRAFAFSGGDLMLWGSEQTMNASHLVGYRNANKRLSWDFTPLNSRMNFSIAACSGRFSFDLRHNTLPHRLTVSISAPDSSLRTCLLAPAPGGFAPLSTETFSATIEITLLVRRFGRDDVVDRVVMRSAAVEFGGAYRCFSPDPCAQQRQAQP